MVLFFVCVFFIGKDRGSGTITCYNHGLNFVV